MDPINKELIRLQKSASLDQCTAQVDELLAILQTKKQQVEQDPEKSGLLMARLKDELKQNEKKLKDSQQTVYSSIAKYGKSLEKTFKNNDVEEVSKLHCRLESGSAELNKAILMHLTRSGEFDVSKQFRNEAKVEVPEHLLTDFAHMFEILQHIAHKNLDPAIEWATAKRHQLVNRGSNLEFSLHKLKFIHYLLHERDTRQALSYARHNLSQFGDRSFNEISKLMSTVLYVDELETSPYKNLVEEPTYEQLSELFGSEFCALLGLTPESPLYLAVIAGVLAIPRLAKMKSVMEKKRTEWTSKDVMPVDVELPDRFNFHAIFVCPVSKEETSEANPPLMIPCGHVLAQNSLKLLAKDDIQHQFKCPYCPSEATYASAKKIYF